MGGNENIILLAGVVMLILLLVTIYVLMQMFGKARRQTKDRLTKLQERFGDKVTRGEIAARAVRNLNSDSELEKALKRLIPNPDQLQIRLERAGLKLELSKYLIYCGILGLATAGFLLINGVALAIALMIAVIVGAGLPHWFITKKINKRVATFTKQFPEALELMVRGLKSGLPVNECIINVGKEIAAPTGTEFKRIANEMKLGKQLEETLWETSERLDTADFKFFVISLVVQRETGGNLGETLGNLSTILRQRQAMKLKIRALSSEAKASAWIVGALPFVMLGLIMMMNYDYGIILFTHPKGIMAGLFGLFMIGFGAFVMAKMVDFEV